MAVLTASFSPPGATNGSTIATTDTGDANAWDAVVINGGGSAAFKYDNSHTRFGKSVAGKMVSNSAASVVEWTTQYGSISSDWGRIYLYLTAYPNNTTLFVSAGNPRIAIGTTGGVFTFNSASLLKSSTTTLSLNQWYRLEWNFVFNASTGVVECKIFTSPDSTTVAETLSSTGLNTR